MIEDIHIERKELAVLLEHNELIINANDEEEPNKHFHIKIVDKC